MSKVYEVESSVTISFNFEVDAKDKTDAVQQAVLKHKQFIESLPRNDDMVSSEVDVESCLESEGH